MGSPQKLPVSRKGKTAMNVALRAARAGGKVIKEGFYNELDVRFKGRGNVVTNVDVQAEKVILAILREEYPDLSIRSEESEVLDMGSVYSWVVDPLDGSRNFASGVPHCCTVIALAQDKEVVLGVTYDPFRDEAFCAEKGKGATLNGKRVAVSDKQELRDCLIGCDLGYVDIKGTHALDLLHRLWPGMQGLRIMGSSSLSLAYASCGRLDLYFHHHLYPWDIAAGLLLVTEAGGVVLDKHGGQSDLSKESVIASSETLVRKFLEATEGFEWRG